nr:OTU domain-containing protein 5-like [Symphalangus syndactylus]
MTVSTEPSQGTPLGLRISSPELGPWPRHPWDSAPAISPPTPGGGAPTARPQVGGSVVTSLPPGPGRGSGSVGRGGGTEVVAVGGGGVEGRGARARTNPRVPGRDPDPAAHREAKPAGWAAEPESGTGEARAELAAPDGSGPTGLQGLGARDAGWGEERLRPTSPAGLAGRRELEESQTGAGGLCGAPWS